ncbi:MAG: peptidoglycan DD-metalloendopeptidase family protein [Proteobacteria bacterium]|nr:peptidoglycan DD-metalloendopeptidase family protein [Pseudomonadota bacterium]
MKAWRLVALLAGGIALAAPAASEDRSRRLDAIRAEIEEREAKARAYAERARKEGARLDGLNRELSELRRSRRRLQRRERDAREDLAEARRLGQQAERQLQGVERDLERRLVALYKSGGSPGPSLLVSAGDAQRLARHRHGLALVLEQDRELFLRYRQARGALQASQEDAERLLGEIAAGRRALAEREAVSRRMRAERSGLVARLRRNSQRESSVAAEMRAAAARLAAKLESLPSSPRGRGAGLPAVGAGWPVQGSIRLSFGRQLDPEFGTETVRNGVEIAANPGDSVRSIGDGSVLFAGWFRGYGQMVIIDHGGGTVAVLGFLEELVVEEGEKVRSGQEIGTVGGIGPLAGPGVYFEIRRDGKAVDPARWLSRAPTGERAG